MEISSFRPKFCIQIIHSNLSALERCRNIKSVGEADDVEDCLLFSSDFMDALCVAGF